MFVMPGHSSLPCADCVNLSAMPGIHVFTAWQQEGRGWPGRSPAMTKKRIVFKCHHVFAQISDSIFKKAKSRRTFAASPRNAPEPLINLSPKEGVGNAGCPLHPRPRVQLVVVERTRVTTSTPESPGIPARNGFNGFLRALVTGLVCHRRQRICFCLGPVGPT